MSQCIWIHSYISGIFFQKFDEVNKLNDFLSFTKNDFPVIMQMSIIMQMSLSTNIEPLPVLLNSKLWKIDLKINFFQTLFANHAKFSLQDLYSHNY